MSLFKYLITITSITFRILSYLYLRWIPVGQIGLFAVPSLFILYITSLIFFSNNTQREVKIISILNPTEKKIKTEKSTKTEVKTEKSTEEKIKTEKSTEEKIKTEKSTEEKIKTEKSNGHSSIKNENSNSNSNFSFHSFHSFQSLINLIINIILLIFVIDFTYRNRYFHMENDLFFHRVSAITHNSAKIIIRYPFNDSLQLLYKHRDINSLYQRGPIIYFSNDTDFVSFAQLNYLDAATEYEYQLEFKNKSKTFLIKGQFHTFPDPSTSSTQKLSFVASSCIKPSFPYDGLLANSLRIKGFEKLSQNTQDLEFLLFLGDFIYSDIPISFGTNIENFRQHYRQIWSSESTQNLSKQLPILFAYDDHEILNNWENQLNDPYNAAIPSSWELYAGIGNYNNFNKTYYSFVYGDIASFFIMDTRKYRNRTENTILGKEQKGELFNWLSKNNGVFKFIISSVPFTKGWKGLDGDLDTWGGYLNEREEILSFIQEKNILNVIFISGDRHEFAAIKYRSNIIEFSTSPLNMFFIPIQTFNLDNSDEDQLIHYVQWGQIKWGRFDIDISNKELPKLTFTLMIDGKNEWKYVHYGVKPIQSKKSKSTISTFFNQSIFERIGEILSIFKQ